MDKVVHFEIPADNLGRAGKFYGGVFGWQMSRVPNMDYYLVTPVACDGNGQLKVIVVNVSSIDSYLKKIGRAGGRIVLPKQKVGDFGLYARVSDTEGNAIGLWQDLK